MRKLLALLFLSASLAAQIIETPHFSEITKFVNSETLVLLDIDDTLLIPTQALGRDVWFIDRWNQHKQSLTDKAALEKALSEWEAVRHLTNVQIVEEGTEKIVADLQKQNIPVMGLTTQGLALATRTVLQLASLEIDLSKTPPSIEDHYFINRHGVLYRKGILFTSGTPKGPALIKLLEILNYCPKRVVFINDKETHLKDVEASALEKGIEFIGLRYSFSDKRVANYRPEIGEIQWTHSTLNHLLSDEEAEALLKGLQ